MKERKRRKGGQARAVIAMVVLCDTMIVSMRCGMNDE